MEKEIRQPTISIVTAVFNSADSLERCIESFELQRYVFKELIVIDGGSTDGGVDIIRAHESALHFWVSEPDRGIYHAWNKALSHCTGEWIHFLGADDYFPDPEVLSRVAVHLSECNDDVRVAYGKIAMVGHDGELFELRGEDWQIAGQRFRQVMSVPHPAVFTRRAVFDDRGLFDESFAIAGDYEHLLRELNSGRAVFFPDIVVKAVLFGGASTSPERALRGALEIVQAKRRNGLPPYDLRWLRIFAESFGKYVLSRWFGERMTKRVVDMYRRLTGRVPVWTKQ
jgi:glycosyltransferase involved in cell wall biosynthesis